MQLNFCYVMRVMRVHREGHLNSFRMGALCSGTSEWKKKRLNNVVKLQAW
jgi:hypothetical protein